MVNGLALVAVVLLPVQGISGTAGEDTAKAIARLEDELTLAFNQYDAAALGRLWADDLTFVFPNGALSSKKDERKPFSMRFRATHVWAKQAGEWKLVTAHVSQMKE